MSSRRERQLSEGPDVRRNHQCCGRGLSRHVRLSRFLSTASSLRTHVRSRTRLRRVRDDVLHGSGTRADLAIEFTLPVPPAPAPAPLAKFDRLKRLANGFPPSVRPPPG